MRLWIKSACVAFVLTVLYSLIPFQAACTDISGEVFRLHILANSDSDADQALKLKVRDSVLACSEALFAQAKSKEEAESLTARHLQELAQVAAATVRENGYDYPVHAEIKKMFFTTRRYEAYTLPSGMYDALRLTIGEGRGAQLVVRDVSLALRQHERRGRPQSKRSAGRGGIPRRQRRKGIQIFYRGAV